MRRAPVADDGFFVKVLDEFLLARGDDPGALFDPQLRFIGGEPYLRFKLIRTLIQRFSSRHPRSLVLINSNGTLISPATAAALAENRRTVHHVVSLDGPREVHNRRRPLRGGGDGFALTIAGIRLLRAHDLPVSVNTVVDPETGRTLDELMKLVKNDLGLADISISLRSAPDDGMDEDDRFRLLALAYDLGQRHGLTVTGHHRLLLGSVIPGLRCRAGEISVLVTSDKTATGCQRFLRDDEQVAYDEDVIHRAASRLAGFPEQKCYTPASLSLGRRLHALYQERFPDYLKVNDADRIVFGVI